MSQPTKDVVVTFDYEGLWGMPHHGVAYDLPAVTNDLLTVLDKHGAGAVFFTSGMLFDDYPDTIKAIHERGHEVGLHGFEHEHLHDLSPEEFSKFDGNLEIASRNLKHLTGRIPVGFRAPYLMGPIFYIPRMYQLLADHGYTWISNRELRTPEELFKPGRIPVGLGLTNLSIVRNPLLFALNPGLIRSDRPAGRPSTRQTLSWMTNPVPFKRPQGLTEHPLVSPLDCDLLGFPLPSEPSGQPLIDYTTKVLLADYKRAKTYFNINAHDWIIGTQDRLQILDTVLKHIAADPLARFVTPGRPGRQS
jgi:peptidoglycan/xylan/chitin deacetylase (PgdA/CDA1 family)